MEQIVLSFLLTSRKVVYHKKFQLKFKNKTKVVPIFTSSKPATIAWLSLKRRNVVCMRLHKGFWKTCCIKLKMLPFLIRFKIKRRKWVDLLGEQDTICTQSYILFLLVLEVEFLLWLIFCGSVTMPIYIGKRKLLKYSAPQFSLV